MANKFKGVFVKKFLSILILFSISSFGNDLEEVNRKLDILAEEIESLKLSKDSPTQEGFSGLGQSASKVYGIRGGTSIGGYGEIVFNSTEGKNSNGEVLRNVLYIGHKFSPKWVLNTEIEMEHVSQIFVEFAYLDYLHSDALNFRAGLILTPLGIVNQLHEPINFHSVNRPEVEKHIIPSTWRELGFGIFGTLGRLEYKQYLMNGLNAEGFDESGLRGGRKKGGVEADDNSKVDTSTVVSVTRLDYNFSSKLMFGAAAYLGASSTVTAGLPAIDTKIFQGHFNFTHSNFFLKGLYALALLNNADDFNRVSTKKVAEEMNGFYVTTGYDFKLGRSLFTPFFRYEKYNTQAKVSSGLSKDLTQDKQNLTFGVSYRPIDKIIFKLDYTSKSNEANTSANEFNFGIGYIF